MYYSIEQWHTYIWGGTVCIKTDNNAVADLGRNSISTSPCAVHWFMTIGQYDYRIEHKNGHKIPHADALSRYPPKDPKDPNEPDDNISPSTGENTVAPLHAVHVATMFFG